MARFYSKKYKRKMTDLLVNARQHDLPLAFFIDIRCAYSESKNNIRVARKRGEELRWDLAEPWLRKNITVPVFTLDGRDLKKYMVIRDYETALKFGCSHSQASILLKSDI
jgi:hypothetical protein